MGQGNDICVDLNKNGPLICALGWEWGGVGQSDNSRNSVLGILPTNFHRMAIVACPCAFPLRTLAQRVLPGFGISFPLCALICMLSPLQFQIA